MMTSLGHEVFLYGGTENDAKVTEFVSVVSDGDRSRWFGHYDWNTMVFDEWKPTAECWTIPNCRIANEIDKRKQPGDILGVISGLCQAQLTIAFPNMRSVEWGIGYEGILDNAFHVFESNAWMHTVYGIKGIRDGRFFDTVIPNSFDEDEFLFNARKDEYLLYLGRLTPRKGLEVVEQLSKRGHRVITAGQGDIRITGAEHRGVVRGKEKAALISGAKALLVPTFYIEPFGGVAVEALLSGTPVLTTDFGAFTETVRDGIDGFRCHTMGEFEIATERVKELDHRAIHNNAQKYLTKNVRHQYDSYFKRLALLDGDGWYDFSK